MKRTNNDLKSLPTADRLFGLNVSNDYMYKQQQQ